MKIAVCFAGFLRSFQATVGNWNFRLSKIEHDVFIHSPNVYYSPLEEKSYDSREKITVEENFVRDCFGDNLKGLSLYDYDFDKFKKVVSQNQLPESNFIGQLAYRILSYQFNIQEVVKMVVDSNIHYDYIMVTRSDLNLYSDFNFNNIDSQKINYPLYHGLTHQGNFKSGVAAVFGTEFAFNDQLFIGKPDQISIFKNIYNYIPNYHNEGIIINSETLLGMHCLKNNVSFGTNDFIKYDLLRYGRI